MVIGLAKVFILIVLISLLILTSVFNFAVWSEDATNEDPMIKKTAVISGIISLIAVLLQVAIIKFS